MSFDGNTYWLERGKTYYREKRLRSNFYERQEKLIGTVVTACRPTSILELGCGYGRITRELAERMPMARIQAYDISPQQITAAREYCRSSPNINFGVMDIQVELFPRGFDLVICCEVLLHQPEEHFINIVNKALGSAKVLIHEIDLDWCEDDAVAEQCFYHDYRKVYQELGLKYRFHTDVEHAIMVVGRKLW